MSDSDDEAPPVAVSTRSTRDAALAAPKGPTRTSVGQSQRASAKRQRGLITADLRGQDYLPPEVLSSLADLPAPPSTHVDEAVPAASARQKKQQAAAAAAAAAAATASSAAERRARNHAASARVMPTVVRKSGNLELAVLESDRSGPRLHAPVRDSVSEFMQRQLYGDRVRRAPSATLSSLKSRSGNFGAASNFSTVPVAASSGLGGKKKRKRAETTTTSAGYSTLEQMAARIMRKKS